jgi:hypothetical protein
MQQGDVVLARINGARLGLFVLAARWTCDSRAEWEVDPLTEAAARHDGRLEERAILRVFTTGAASS